MRLAEQGDGLVGNEGGNDDGRHRVSQRLFPGDKERTQQRGQKSHGARQLMGRRRRQLPTHCAPAGHAAYASAQSRTAAKEVDGDIAAAAKAFPTGGLHTHRVATRRQIGDL